MNVKIKWFKVRRVVCLKPYKVTLQSSVINGKTFVPEMASFVGRYCRVVWKQPSNVSLSDVFNQNLAHEILVNESL